MAGPHDPQDTAHRFLAAGTVEGVEIRLLQLPVAESFIAAHGATDYRDLAVIRIVGLTPSGVASGWGECAALPTGGYWPETAADSFQFMADAARTLLETDIGTLTTPVDLPGHVDWAPRPMVRAAVEMAALDLALKASNTSLARWLGTSRATVPAGATIGLGSRQELNDKIEALLDLGYRRIKLKIEPGRDLDVVAAAIDTVRRRATSTRIQVDANGSYPPSSQSLNSLVALARLGVSVIEQPFAPDRTEASKSLISTFVSAGIGTLVLADEGASSFDEALKRIREGAASGLVVKPSRLGGIREAVRLMAHCRQHRLPVSVGGMLESGLGRHALAAVAALEGASVTGDLSPARRFLGDDPWPDITMVNGSTSTEGAKISVPSAPGVAPAPDELRLDLYTVERRQLGDVHV